MADPAPALIEELGRRLQAAVVPVLAERAAILAQLAQLGALPGAPLTTGATGEGQRAPAEVVASLLCRVCGTPAAMLHRCPAAATPEQMVDDARRIGSSWLIMGLSPGYALAERTILSAPSLALVHNVVPDEIRQILVVVRSEEPEVDALRWVTPLARECGAAVTLLMAQDGDESRRPLRAGGLNPPGRPIKRVLQQAGIGGEQARLRQRTGSPMGRVVDELHSRNYDLVAVVARHQGHFGHQLLHTLDTEKIHTGRPLFIVKPAHAKTISKLTDERIES
jgi:nucleotide-binding universal stress UspA family protein